MKSVGGVFKPMGRLWADRTVQHMKPRVPYRTGNLRGSIRRRNATAKKAVVVGHYSAFFIDAGVVPHTITAKGRGLSFKVDGRSVFAKKVNHRGFKARPFRAKSAGEARDEVVNKDALVKAWNDGA
jgi:hypothetical protein